MACFSIHFLISKKAFRCDDDADNDQSHNGDTDNKLDESVTTLIFRIGLFQFLLRYLMMVLADFNTETR